ncbi:MAG: acyltransferase family protein [Lachnospiraceae bacterium]|nr:acyltransferase family protein [Lachnospiraceae bacterium]
MNQQKNERVCWIDICKGLAIMLVILGHTYRSNGVQNWLYAFHMPIFFVLSGWIRGNKGKVNSAVFIKKQALGLLWPYVLFEVLTYLYWIVVESHFRNFDFGPLWFLVALFFIEVICNAVIVNRSKLTTAVLVMICLLLFWLGSMYVDPTLIVAWIPRTAGGMTFYLVGLLASKYRKIFDVQRDISKRSIIICLVVGMVLTIPLSMYNGRVDMYNLKAGNIVVYFIAALVGSAMLCSLSMFINKNKVIEFFGRYSILILCTHEPIKRAVIYVTAKITGIESEEVRNLLVGGVLITVVVLLIEVVVISIFRLIADKTKGSKIAPLIEFVK